ncbi:MAG TPA: subclass B3 metallo-beta-lactamase [Steroidobacteraceae bacterium]
MSRSIAPATVFSALVVGLAAFSVSAGKTDCPMCERWNAPQEPFRIYGNTYYVGPRGLSSVLITSPEGHVLIDGGLPQSAPVIAANIEKLGFKIEDVTVLLHSHTHFDHAGGLAELKRLSGASLATSPLSALAFEHGLPIASDPQAELREGFPAIKDVEVIQDGHTLRVGPIAITGHYTPGHTPGGMSWSWQSCEGKRCLNLVYGDSLTAVSQDDFRFSDSKTYPHVLEDFRKSFGVFESLPCDILITAHPEATGLWEKLAAREAGDPDALIKAGACRDYAANARQKLNERVEREKRETSQRAAEAARSSEL